jgi:hypothetical protein
MSPCRQDYYQANYSSRYVLLVRRSLPPDTSLHFSNLESSMCTFMWATGINHTSSLIFTTPAKKGGYGFTARSLGFIYFAPLIAVCFGELFGHFFNDFLAHRYIKSHAGRFKPETRLWSNYVAAVIMIPGITLFGQALGHQLPWIALAFGWGMYLFGAMVASVSTTAYALDCYPTSPGEIAAFINLARVLGGFSVGYFQLPWGQAVGYDVAFGTQAGIISFAVGVLVVIHIYGPRLRKWGGAVET